MTSVNLPNFDPKTTATQLAQKYIQGAQDSLNVQTKATSDMASALSMLGTSLTAFYNVLGSMSDKKSVLANSATFSSDVGIASATSTADAGTYQFYVQQIATANQVSYAGVQNNTQAAGAGTLGVTFADNTSFSVDLSAADRSGDGVLTAKEIATAINVSADNKSRVSASTMTINGATTLVLTSSLTGTEHAVTLDVSQLSDANLAMQLDTGNKKVRVAAKDAIVWVGDPADPGGDAVQLATQASNTFDVIDGVSMTFTKAHEVGAPPVTLTVDRDYSGTADNVQAFVDGWNALIGTINTVSDHGDPNNGKAPSAFASDSALTLLHSNMVAMLRTTSNGLSFANYGIALQHDGTLSLDKKRLKVTLDNDPVALDEIFGSATPGSESGALGGLHAFTYGWVTPSRKVGVDPITNKDIFAPGTLALRKDVNSSRQKALANRQALISASYDSAYNRYLAEFTQLQALQSQMTTTSSIFDALFAKDG